MRNGFKVIDCDRHVVEPADIWDRYLDKRFQHYDVRQQANSLSTTVGGVRPGSGGLANAPRAGGQAQAAAQNAFAPIATTHQGFARDPIWRNKFKGALVRGFNTESYLFDMDKEGVDTAVCFTGMGLYATWSDDLDPALSDAMCRSYNNWLYDYMSPNPERLKGVCLHSRSGFGKDTHRV